MDRLLVAVLSMSPLLHGYCPMKPNPARPASLYCANELRKNPFGNNTIDMDSYSPAFPLIMTLFDTPQIQLILVVFGTQIMSHDEQHYQAYHNMLTTNLNANKYRPAYWDSASFVDVVNVTNYIYFAYFTDTLAFTGFVNSKDSEYHQWMNDAQRLSSEENGYFEEIFFIPMDNAETVHTANYAESDIKGVSNLATVFYEDRRHGYFCSARDRMAASAFNPFSVDPRWTLSAEAQLGETRGKKYKHVAVPPNLSIIRSGQDLTNAVENDRVKYEQELQPVLMEGMRYLMENPVETQCVSLRFIHDMVLNEDSGEYAVNAQRAGFGYFVNLLDLEMWAAHHRTHLNIFNKFMKIASDGDLASIYLWHEVFVVSHGYANYINVHNKTSFLRWYADDSNSHCPSKE